VNTPIDSARTIIRNIEATREMMEEGPIGWVAHTDDHMLFLCQFSTGTTLHLGPPMSEDVAVQRTERQAEVMLRWWCRGLPEDIDLQISLRRDALTAYIDTQQALLDALLEHGACPAP
jgi:hypothetical protein